MFKYEVGQRAIVNEQPCTRRVAFPWYDSPEVRWFRDDGRIINDTDVVSVRPLLTLDPDNPEQMQALYKAWATRVQNDGRVATLSAGLTDAIRSLLPPPVEPDIVHKATMALGPIKSLCGTAGYQLAEKWENVTCDKCLSTTPEPNGRGAYVESGAAFFHREEFLGTDSRWPWRGGTGLLSWDSLPQPVTVHFHGVGCTCTGPGCPGAA